MCVVQVLIIDLGADFKGDNNTLECYLIIQYFISWKFCLNCNSWKIMQFLEYFQAMSLVILNGLTSHGQEIMTHIIMHAVSGIWWMMRC